MFTSHHLHSDVLIKRQHHATARADRKYQQPQLPVSGDRKEPLNGKLPETDMPSMEDEIHTVVLRSSYRDFALHTIYTFTGTASFDGSWYIRALQSV